MPLIRLRDLWSEQTKEFEAWPIRLGRNSDLEVVPSGPGSEVVSGLHASLRFEHGRWWIEDLGSSNGTFLDGRRLDPGEARRLVRGSVVRLGSSGPRYDVVAVVEQRASDTVAEGLPAVHLGATVPMSEVELTTAEDGDGGSGAEPPSRAPKLTIELRETRDDVPYQVSGGRIRIGRGSECELRPLRDGDTGVSRVHAEIVLSPDGKALLRDAQSRNGTLVNGGLLTAEHEVAEGDRIELGRGGPELRVESIVVPRPARSPVTQPATLEVSVAPTGHRRRRPLSFRRTFGGRGRTSYVRAIVRETTQRTSRKLKTVVFSSLAVLTAVIAGTYWYNDRRVRETTTALRETAAALAKQQSLADSVSAEAQADRDRLRGELADARASSAPTTVVDSLRRALDSATERTMALQVSLERAREDLSQQLSEAETLRRAREQEVRRLDAELRRATASRVSASLLDSLQRRIDEAQRRAAALDGQLRAVQGVNLAEVAQVNQAAVGLVSTYVGSELFAGSGFVIDSSGHFITNRHVVMPDGRYGDSVFVTMADHRDRRPAAIVRIQEPPGPDLAVLRIQGYTGPYVPRVDWGGANVRQGEPAALIGFPAGLVNALDLTATVRTSMTGGIFSKVASDLIQFDGFTIGGSSGSPIFNANGEVVAVHRAGLREAVGLAFAVPVSNVVPLLPAGVRQQLGIPIN